MEWEGWESKLGERGLRGENLGGRKDRIIGEGQKWGGTEKSKWRKWGGRRKNFRREEEGVGK